MVEKKVAKSKKEMAPKVEKAVKKDLPAKNVGQIKVTQIASPIGRQGYQKKTLIGLRLNKLNRSSILQDTLAIRGMIKKVHHLVKVEDI